MIRVALIWEVTPWMGGVNYFRNLVAAVSSLTDKKIEVILFTGHTTNTHGMEDYVSIVHSSIFDRGTFQWMLRQSVAKSWHDFCLYRLLKKYNIQIISHYPALWKDAPIPALPWIPDFQDIHLPHLFDDKLLQTLRKTNQGLSTNNQYILLSSHEARHDYESFMMNEPDPVAKPMVMHFVSCLMNDAALLRKDNLITMYKLPQNWFFLPNQFWKHKNHSVVIDALDILRKQGKSITVVATGNQTDHRNPGYFEALMESLEKKSLQKNFLYLGQLPYTHMLALMKYSMAVINPSLFEGWSSTVEEAKSLGKALILSDIPVHREQKPVRAQYFASDDIDELACILRCDAMHFNAQEDRKYMQDASHSRDNKRKMFGECYQNIILDCVISL